MLSRALSRASTGLLRTASFGRGASAPAAAPLPRCFASHSHAPAAHGHGHDDAHAHDEHHAPLSPEAQAYEATTSHLFGEEPHAGGRHAEAWELPFALTAVGFFLIVVALQYRPSTDPHEWARAEAEERMRRRDAGLPVHFGVQYSALRYLRENGAITEAEAERLEAGGEDVSTPLPALRSSHTM